MTAPAPPAPPPPPLELACADFTFPLLPHDRVLALIAALEIPAVDIGLFEDRSHLQPGTEFQDTGRVARALRTRLDAHGLRAADVFLQVDSDGRSYAVNHPLAARRHRARDWFERALEYAAACGAGHVSIGPGVPFADAEPPADSLARCHAELAWRVERARAAGIVMGVEPHLGSVAASPAAALRLVEAVPGLTFTLDYGHFARAGIPTGRSSRCWPMPATSTCAAPAAAPCRHRCATTPSTSRASCR